MVNQIDDICRICLKVGDTDFLPLDEYRITKLKVIIPQLNIDVTGSSRFMMCIKCKDALDEASNLRRKILDNQELIRSRKSKLGIEIKVNLTRIFNKNESKWSHNTICRVCLNLSKDQSIFIDSLPPDDPFQDVLHTCLTILDRDLVANPFLCSRCVDKLLETFSFISSALTVDAKILKYCKSNPDTKDLLENQTLHQVLNMLKENGEKDEETNNDFLSEFEVQDEEGNDIFDCIPVDEPANGAKQTGNNVDNAEWKSDDDVTKKRPAETPVEAIPAKKPKLKVPQTEELPKFNFNFIFSQADGISLSDWLSIVEMQKNKFKWSDNVTIQKVLLRLQNMPEVCSWFNSMGDILSWEEWKKKLMEAYPDQDDFSMCLRRAMKRKRKNNETFVHYAKIKAELLKKVNITGEQAVCCIINGFSMADVLVVCLSRLGKYKTVEELSEYLKKWDEKKAVSDKTDNSKLPGTAVAQVVKVDPASTKPATANAPPQASVKKAKAKCLKCQQVGHFAVECKAQEPAAGPSKVQAKPKAKKQPVVCKYCGKLGHNMQECLFAKMARSANNRDQFPKKPNPKKVRFSSSPPECLPEANGSLCNQPGHFYDECCFPNQKPVKNALKEGAQSMQPLKISIPELDERNESECRSCGSTKHYTRHCGKRAKIEAAGRLPQRREETQGREEPVRQAARREEPVRQAARLEETVRHERREETVRHAARLEETVWCAMECELPVRYDQIQPCYYCGSESHLSSACYYMGQPSLADFQKVKREDAHFQQLMCFGCYKVGHSTRDCPRGRGNSDWP